VRRVLLTGGSGQLGSALAAAFGDAELLAAPAHGELDVSDEEKVLAEVLRLGPDVILNCASYNDVDGAEENPLAALMANGAAVRGLARAADAVGATLVHYGSDFVFDGTASRPYTEEDRPRPRSVYGASKLAGERFAREARRHYVLRVESLFGGARPKSTIDKMVAALARGETVRAFVDRVVTPSFVEDVARATREVVDRGLPFGVYHCVNSGITTWCEVARHAARLLGREEALVEPISVEEVQLRAARPRYCALDNAKLAEAGVSMPGWREALSASVSRRPRAI